MKYCKVCLQTNTRPNEQFTNEGLCHACNINELIINADYIERFKILENIINNRTKKKNQFFDCIIGVSGGKDSTRQALWVRDKLKLNPLLVSLSYPPEQVSQLGVDNLSNLINLGFDVIVSGPAPGVWRRLIKEAFMKFANWAKAAEVALYGSVPKMAIKYNIELIFIGENQSLRDPKTIGRNPWEYNNISSQNTLDGGDISWMQDTESSMKNLIPYTFPTSKEITNANLNIIDLGWFMKDWDNQTNAEYSCLSGIEIRTDSPQNTGDLLGVSALDEDWVTLNQMIKYYKFGFGKVTDYVNEDIRAGRISRENAIKLVEKYDGCCSHKYIKSFCDYIEISTDNFWECVKDNLNKELFEIDSNGKIQPLFKVGHGL